MATETQKNFHKQMKEISEERKGMVNPKVYSYIDKDFTSSRIYFTRRRAVSISGIITVIALLIYAYPLFKNTIHRVSAYNQKPVIEYLNQIRVYDNQMKAMTNTVNDNIKNLNMRSVDSKKQFVTSMNDNLNSIQNMSSEVSKVKAPEGLEDHKALEIQRCLELSNAIKLYIQGASNNNQQSFDDAHDAYSKYGTDGNQQRQILMQTFEKYNIKYEVNSDGSIHYEYKTMN